MKKESTNQRYLSALLILVCSCSPIISGFDQYAYTQATSLKVDALNLMDLSTDQYTQHKVEIAAVQSNLQKIYEYEKNRPKN